MPKATSESTDSAKPLLSLLLCSRNDGFMGNSLWRLQTTLNVGAANARAAGALDEVEFVLCDWGSEQPLADALQLTPDATRVTRVVEVPPPLARQLQQDSPFSEVHALNAAARRARGYFCGRIDQDTVVGSRAFKHIIALASRRIDASDTNNGEPVLYFSERREVPTWLVHDSPHPANVLDYLRSRGGKLPRWGENDPNRGPFWTSAVGIMLLPRSLWLECRGYDERMIYRNGMEYNFVSRVMSRYPVRNLGPAVDFDFYHLGHERVLHGPGGRKAQSGNPDPGAREPPFSPNSPGWGLARETLSELQPQTPSNGSIDLLHPNSAARQRVHAARFTFRVWRRQLWYWISLPTLLDAWAQGGWREWVQALRTRYSLFNLRRHLRSMGRKITSTTPDR